MEREPMTMDGGGVEAGGEDAVGGGGQGVAGAGTGVAGMRKGGMVGDRLFNRAPRKITHTPIYASLMPGRLIRAGHDGAEWVFRFRQAA